MGIGSTLPAAHREASSQFAMMEPANWDREFIADRAGVNRHAKAALTQF
jgi:hypothetical protein